MEQVYLVLTERCNLSCGHCIRDSSPWRNEAAELELMLEALVQVKAAYPAATVLLTGGEPTLYKGFEAILARSASLGLDVMVNTNGTTSYFSPTNNKVLADSGALVQVSLDGTPSLHDGIRGKGTHGRAVSRLRALVAAGVRCSVSATVMEATFFENVDEFLDDLDAIGLVHVAIKRATYAGRASSGCALESADWNAGVYATRKTERRTPLIMTPMYDFDALARLSDEQVAAIDTGPYGTNCGAGTAKVYVYPNGDVCSCTCFRDLPIGNLYSRVLQEIVLGQEELRVSSEICEGCRYFVACKGGCLGSGYRYSGRIGSPDPRCTIVAADKQADGSVV